MLAAVAVVPKAETVNFSSFARRWVSFSSESDSNVMVVKSIHSAKDVSKRNGFLFDYFGRRKVNVTVERLAGVKFSNVWKDSVGCLKTLLHVRSGRPQQKRVKIKPIKHIVYCILCDL
jgi:hypothetical protein